MKPRPTPVAPPKLDDSHEFDRPVDFATQSGGPRDFARLTQGSEQKSGKSRIIVPDRVP